MKIYVYTVSIKISLIGAHKDKQFVKVEEKKDNLICQILEN